MKCAYRQSDRHEKYMICFIFIRLVISTFHFLNKDKLKVKR